MALSGKGMLVIMTDIPAADEAEFNRWYDREHTQERVAIPGFLNARRWVRVRGDAPQYLALYETGSFDVLSSPPYKAALAAQTQWSKDVMGRFQNVKRSVARITLAEGLGSGGAIAVVRVRAEAGHEDALRDMVHARLRDIVREAGIVSAFLMESDPVLSKPLPEHKVDPNDDSSRDWLICVEGTNAAELSAAVEAKLADAALASAGGKVLALAMYALMWGVTRAEMEREGAAIG